MRYNLATLDDESHRPKRCQTLLILFEFHLPDLPLLLGESLEITVLGLLDLSWSLRFLQTEQNFLNHLVTVLWSTVFTVCTTNIFCYFWTRKVTELDLCGTFICVAFKSHKKWSNAPSTTVLLTIVNTFHSLNCFGHMIYMQQTCTKILQNLWLA